MFVSLSSALFIAFFAARIMEFFSIATTYNLPADIRNVIVQALLFDIVSFLKMLPFLFVPFLVVYLSTGTMKSRYWAYGLGGSIVLILYAVLITYFATAAVPLGADIFGYSMKEIEVTVRGGTTINAITVFLFIIPLSVVFFMGKCTHTHDTYFKRQGES